MNYKEAEYPSIFHITCVMHNSRVSQRMIDYHVKLGEPEYLNFNEEKILIEIICKIIKEDNLQILSFTICADHLHFVIECYPNNLTKIVRKIKSKSAREFNIWRGITIPIEPSMKEKMGHAPLAKEIHGKNYNSLWAQKFNRVEIVSDNQFYSVMEYIDNNRIKHNLSPLSNNSLQLIKSIIVKHKYW